MKKPILLLIFFLTLISTQTLLAQDNDAESHGEHDVEKYSEVGLNATSFINEFISLNSNDASIGDYMISYKYHFGSKALRFGLGGNFSSTDEDTGGNGSRTTQNNNFDLRMGYEWNKKVSKRWAFFTGVDLVVSNDYLVSSAENFEVTKTTTRTSSYGGGPILGIQFFINSHISLRTEGSLYYRHSIINEKTDFSVSSEFNTDETDNKDDLNFGLPTALFFVIRF